jgi:hypothetical protein
MASDSHTRNREEPATSDETPRVEASIYHLYRGSRREEERAMAACDLRHALRYDDKEVPESDETRLYDYEGTDTLLDPEDDDHDVLGRVWEIWNGATAPTWSDYEPSEVRSLEVGDVVTVDGRAYWCAPFGWERAEHLDDALDVEEGDDE